MQKPSFQKQIQVLQLHYKKVLSSEGFLERSTSKKFVIKLVLIASKHNYVYSKRSEGKKPKSEELALLCMLAISAVHKS